jgi:hypothetical protein
MAALPAANIAAARGRQIFVVDVTLGGASLVMMSEPTEGTEP